MILYKPYIHLVKIRNTSTYRLSLLLLLPDEYDIIVNRQTHNAAVSLLRLHLSLVSIPGQKHSGFKEYLLYLNHIRQDYRIEVSVVSKFAPSDLPGIFDPFATSHSNRLTVLGQSVGAALGVEEIDDDREGMEKDKTTDPED